MAEKQWARSQWSMTDEFVASPSAPLPSEQPLPTLTFDLCKHTLSSPHLLQCLNTGVRNPVSTHSRHRTLRELYVCVRRACTHAHDNIVNSLSYVVTSAFHQYFNSLGKTLYIQWHVHTQTHASAKSEYITKHNICKLHACIWEL